MPHLVRGLLYALGMCRIVPVIALLSALLFGCTGSSIPQPPNLMPVQPDDLTPDSEPEHVPNGIRTIQGLPGAADPGVEVWIWNLERTHAPTVTLADDEGAFRVEIAHDPGEEVRLQARSGLLRSEPVDVVYTEAELVFADRPSCVVIPLEVDLGARRAAPIEIVNECGFDVTLDGFALRQDFGGITLDGPATAILPDGATVMLNARAPGVGTAEDIALISVSAPEVARYPVTVITRSD